MLQPQQLQDVSARYVTAIAEMRDFLSKVGVPTGKAAALGDVAARIQKDRTFRRDLTSHVWVVIEDSDRRISYSDLLGVLAIAAAGIHFAADADDYGAHDLLRFLMEARRSLEEPPEVESSTSAKLSEESPISPVDKRRALLDGPLRARKATEFPPDPPQGEPGRPIAWMIAAALLLAALVAGVGLRSRSASTTAATPHRLDKSVAPSPVTVLPETPYLDRDTAATALPLGPVPPSSRSLRGAVSHAAAPISRETPNPPSPMEMDRSAQDAPVPGISAEEPSAAPPSAATLPTLRANVTGSTSAIPSAVLSKRVGSRPLAFANGDDRAADNAKYPRLLRRRPLSTAPAGDDTSLVAENRPPNGPPLIRSDVAVSRGVVRPISLGIMAANVLYSPAPAYPVAASAANVQGEVKVEAQVDRDGNVASARVVSGPPMLRDAAMDAVQHWRYRPFLAAGKPTSMNATAIVDFQLP